MLPVTAMQQIVAIPDDAFSSYTVPGNQRQHMYLEFYPERQYTGTMIIAPHHHEAWLNTHLFKIALFCRANNIKLVSVGHANQLPFFGMFSDAVILQRGPLEDMFGWYSTFSTDTAGFAQLPGFVDVYKHDDLPWEQFPGAVEATVPGARQKYRSPWRAIYGHYSAEHVVGVFSDCRIFIRESSRRTFEQLNAENKLPRNAIWCEVKERFGKVNTRLANLMRLGVPLVGLDKQMQRELVQAHGADFMTLQILCSLLNNCRMFLAAGSAHVFAVAPANIAVALAPADRFYSAETEQIVRKFNLHRFGSVPYVEEATLTSARAADDRQHSARAEDEAVAHWQLDYFLTEPALRAYIDCALQIAPRRRIEEWTWDQHVAARQLDCFTGGQKLRFQRSDGYHLTDISLRPDGTLAPQSENEMYWNQVGSRIAFKTDRGELSTAFEVESADKLHGVFIYNQSIEHQLLTT